MLSEDTKGQESQDSSGAMKGLAISYRFLGPPIRWGWAEKRLGA